MYIGISGYRTLPYNAVVAASLTSLYHDLDPKHSVVWGFQCMCIPICIAPMPNHYLVWLFPLCLSLWSQIWTYSMIHKEKRSICYNFRLWGVPKAFGDLVCGIEGQCAILTNRQMAKVLYICGIVALYKIIGKTRKFNIRL